MRSRDWQSAECTVAGCGRRADYSPWTCCDCVLRVSKQLREIGELWIELSADPAYGAGDGQPRARGKKRPAPGRLDVIAATDPRSVPYALGPDDVDGDVRSVPGSLASMVEWLEEEFGSAWFSFSDPPGPVARLLILLPMAAGRQWFDELASDIAELHAQLQRLTGRKEPSRSLAPCPECGGDLRHVRGDSGPVAVSCVGCGAKFSGAALVELANGGR